MIVKLFTGHVLDLNQIQAIGPVMRSTKQLDQLHQKIVLYIDIHLLGGGTLHHEAYHETFMVEGNEDQRKAFGQITNRLIDDRDHLIELWYHNRPGEPLFDRHRLLSSPPEPTPTTPNSPDHA